MTVTELDLASCDAAVALWTECGLTRPWNDAHADFTRAVEGPASTVLGVLDGDRLVGTVMVGVDGHRGWVYYLAAATDRRRTGLGRRLMAAAEDWVEARGMPKIQLMVRRSNAAVVGFYTALGYEEQDTLLLGRRFDGSSGGAVA